MHEVKLNPDTVVELSMKIARCIERYGVSTLN